MRSDWIGLKQRSMEDIKGAEIDELAVPLVEKLNAASSYYTTSSCAGRINLLEVDDFGKKSTASFLATWHGPCTLEGLKQALSKATRQVWLKAEPPILHVSCRDLDVANALLKTCYSAGFKYSSIKSLKNGVLVEINSTEKMEVPLVEGGNLLVSDSYLEYLVSMANRKIAKAHAKLERLTGLL